MNGINYFKSRFLKTNNRGQSSRTRIKESQSLYLNDLGSSSNLPFNPHRSKRLEKSTRHAPSLSQNDLEEHTKEKVWTGQQSLLDTKKEIIQSPNRKRSISNIPIKITSSLEGEDEEDPLNFLHIQSAAQWKALSQRISLIESKNKDDTATFSNEIVGSPSKRRNVVQPKSILSSHKLNNNTSYTVKITPSDNPSDFVPTKVASLRLICWRIKPWGNKSNPSRPVGKRLFSSQFAVQWDVDCDEVYPSLFIGDKSSASNLGFLKKLGITHVLNTAEGDEEGLVNLSQKHYEGTKIIYKGFPLWDCPNCNILPYLGPAADFIKDSIYGGGKCLVNCQMGVSRSATCALSFLMIYEDLSASQAISQFRYHRDIRPNDGFLEIIASLDNELRKEREFGIIRSFELAPPNAILPRCENTEFWVDIKDVSEDDVGGTLISLFDDTCTKKIPNISSKTSKSSSPRRWSRSISRKSSFINSRAVSRNSSFYDRNRKTPSICITPSEKAYPGYERDNNLEDGDDWEWAWEYKDDNNQEDMSQSSPLTTRKLEKVKNIIEKPEERWRILWDKGNMETPSPIGSYQSRCSSINKNLIQPKANESEILESLLLKVDSAKKWKSISQKVSINFDDINISESQEAEEKNEDVSLVLEIPQTPIDFKPTLSKQLRILCWKIKPWDTPKERNLFTSVMGSGWGVDCDEIYPHIFLGDEASARNLSFLKKIKVTHVLNTAQGKWTDYSFVDLTKDYYDGTGITYQGFELWDHPGVNIQKYFGPANEFISSCIEGGGRVLVHCQMGVSRSCVCAMSYLMLTKGFSAVQTLKIFRSRRDVHPNDHFLSQVAELDNELRKERDYRIPSTIKLFALKDVPNFPKPYHFEFWDTVPHLESLPFILSHQNVIKSNKGFEPQRIDMEDDSLVQDSGDRNSISSSEWEYYTETEDEESTSD
ncbi:uncharacterized protein [Lepeophtheirus salmonis]|uniref:uncharacterized protein n=1 Tax=Lepeophtheirus salmonis TaxID=72036 RepID=UPI001AE9C092|nr:uncharacterized protein LOC121126722 [Lepeophtheirus salmonis]XP_040577982.1 uncharacterized protein LOC121126722 [Lepeophtheirus salmonis]XP_040577991.1 uncharacterized protein LOC121126722 [Lepeophtheirus salmonis]